MNDILFGTGEKKERPVDLSDITVFKRQYDASYRQLKYLGMHYMPGQEEVVEDLIQDLWLRVWERKEMYSNEVSFRRYLSLSLYNSIVNYLKHDRVVQNFVVSRLNMPAETEEEVSRKMIEAEVYNALNSAFDELSDSCRRVYAARLEGKSHKEIAETLGITINTVKKHINNANHYMRQRLKDFVSMVLFMWG